MLGLLKQRWEDTGSRPLTVVEDRRRLVGDALTGDRRGLDSLIRGRAGSRSWADSVAGQMERHYSPGRTWQATLRGLLGLVQLGRALDVASGDCAIAELLAPRAERITCL